MRRPSALVVVAAIFVLFQAAASGVQAMAANDVNATDSTVAASVSAALAVEEDASTDASSEIATGDNGFGAVGFAPSDVSSEEEDLLNSSSELEEERFRLRAGLF